MVLRVQGRPSARMNVFELGIQSVVARRHLAGLRTYPVMGVGVITYGGDCVVTESGRPLRAPKRLAATTAMDVSSTRP